MKAKFDGDKEHAALIADCVQVTFGIPDQVDFDAGLEPTISMDLSDLVGQAIQIGIDGEEVDKYMSGSTYASYEVNLFDLLCSEVDRGISQGYSIDHTKEEALATAEWLERYADKLRIKYPLPKAAYKNLIRSYELEAVRKDADRYHYWLHAWMNEGGINLPSGVREEMGADDGLETDEAFDAAISKLEGFIRAESQAKDSDSLAGLRDQFAMRAMPSLMDEWTVEANQFSGPIELAEAAYEYADAMIVARSVKSRAKCRTINPRSIFTADRCHYLENELFAGKVRLSTFVSGEELPPESFLPGRLEGIKCHFFLEDISRACIDNHAYGDGSVSAAAKPLLLAMRKELGAMMDQIDSVAYSAEMEDGK